MPILRGFRRAPGPLGQGLNYPIDDGLHLGPLLVTVGSGSFRRGAQRVDPRNAVK